MICKKSVRAPGWMRAGLPSLPLRQLEKTLCSECILSSPNLLSLKMTPSILRNEGKVTYATSSYSFRVKLSALLARTDSSQTLGGSLHETRKVAISRPTVKLNQHCCKLVIYGHLEMEPSQFQIACINYVEFAKLSQS